MPEAPVLGQSGTTGTRQEPANTVAHRLANKYGIRSSAVYWGISPIHDRFGRGYTNQLLSPSREFDDDPDLPGGGLEVWWEWRWAEGSEHPEHHTG